MDSLFIHIPKCAGTSIIESLKFKKYACREDYNKYNPIKDKSVSFGHAYLKSLIELGIISASDIEMSFIFTCVRNPYDRFVSLYKHCKRTWPKSFPSDYGFLSFSRFIERYHIQEIGAYNASGLSQLNLQLDWLYDSIEFYPDFIIRFENLEKDFQKLCKKGGFEARISHLNKSKDKKEWIEYYEEYPEIIETVNKIYKKDFKVLQYKML